ncbi:hypothetical protein V8E54_002405 [Elaphomyces granulatus]
MLNLSGRWYPRTLRTEEARITHLRSGVSSADMASGLHAIDQTWKVDALPHSLQQIAYPNTQTIIGEPLPDAEYEWHEAVENAYRQHALGKGYGESRHRWAQKVQQKERKCNCPFRIVAIEDPVTLKWKAFIKEEHHNHDPALSQPVTTPTGAQENEPMEVTKTDRTRRRKQLGRGRTSSERHSRYIGMHTSSIDVKRLSPGGFIREVVEDEDATHLLLVIERSHRGFWDAKRAPKDSRDGDGDGHSTILEGQMLTAETIFSNELKHC